jgi:hypothetical protein
MPSAITRSGPGVPGQAGSMKNVLDVSCGGRMFWFNKKKENVVFVDIRIEHLKMKDSSDRRARKKH